MLRNFQKRVLKSKFTPPVFLPVANLLIVWIENVRLYFSQTDSFLYLGYAMNYSGLQEHWGRTYAASRLSTILPIAFREHFEISNQIWRIGLLSVVTLSIYFFMIKRTSSLKAFLISLVSSNTIWLLNHLSDDMNFAYAIIYMSISITLFDHAISRVKNTEIALFHILTGVFVGLTLNSHFVYLFTVLPIFGGVFLFRLKTPRKILLLLSYMLAGVTLSYILIIIVSIHLSGLTGVLNHLILAKQLLVNSGDSGRIWTQPILYFFPFFFIILVVPMISVIKHRIKPISIENKELELSVGILLMGMISVAYHFSFGGPILSQTRYCSIYLAPILFLVSLLLIDSKVKHLVIALIAEILIILVFQIIPGWQTSDRLNSIFRIFIILPLLISFSLAKKTNFTNKIGLSVLFIVFALPLTQTWSSYIVTKSPNMTPNGEYREFLRASSNGNSYDEQMFAATVAQNVKREIPTTFYGWTIYPKYPTLLSAIDATQLWGYSCYKCMAITGIPTDRTYPPFTQEDYLELKKRDYILIFDTSKTGYEEMKKALLELSPNFTIGVEHVTFGKSNVLYFAYIYTGLPR